MSYCKKCGNELKSGSKFCKKCGFKRSTEEGSKFRHKEIPMKPEFYVSTPGEVKANRNKSNVEKDIERSVALRKMIIEDSQLVVLKDFLEESLVRWEDSIFMNMHRDPKCVNRYECMRSNVILREFQEFQEFAKGYIESLANTKRMFKEEKFDRDPVVENYSRVAYYEKLFPLLVENRVI